MQLIVASTIFFVLLVGGEVVLEDSYFVAKRPDPTLSNGLGESKAGKRIEHGSIVPIWTAVKTYEQPYINFDALPQAFLSDIESASERTISRHHSSIGYEVRC
jgi:hypothetical protein